MTPVDLVQVTVYQSLEERFREAEDASAKARERLRFLRAFGWVPVAGGKISEVNTLLDIAYYQGRAGRNLASAYRAAIISPLADLPPEEAAAHVSRVLREAAPQLGQVREDLNRVARLGERLKGSERGLRYGDLLDRYLPTIQTVAYLSRNSPEVIAHTYVLSRELSALRELAADPLDVIANPQEVGQSLSNVETQASALELALDVVRQATRAAAADGGGDDLGPVREMLDTLVPGVTLLRRVTAGTRSLVSIAEAMETSGFLSPEFGMVSGAALDRARTELTLARQEVASLQGILSFQGLAAEEFLPPVLFEGGGSDVSVGATERVEALLDEAISATSFLYSVLGFERPLTYLILGQNQNEIRATGGFIGIGVEMRISGGVLEELVYHDSTTVDQEPYTSNPPAPLGIYWYLWLGRLPFRDANWNPHFPGAASTVADIFELGQGIKADGVVAGTKGLMLDLVEAFGDVRVPGDPKVLTRETANAYSEGQATYSCAPRHVSERGKRCFDEDVFFALEKRVTTSALEPPLRRRLVELVQEHLDKKNVLVHVFQPIDDSFLWERGWNGALPLVDHDFLMVVDSSLPGHSAAKVNRSWEYSVSLDPGRPVSAELRIRYDNVDEAKDEVCRQFVWGLYHCYWNYFRVYIPQMADIREIRMPPVPLQQGALKLIWGYPDSDSSTITPGAQTGPSRLTELSGYIAVEPGSVTTVPIQYELPPEFLRPVAADVYEYRLLIQKQPGMDRDQVGIGVQLPSGASLVEASPAFTSRRGDWLLFDFPLVSDTTVAVSFRMEDAQ